MELTPLFKNNKPLWLARGPIVAKPATPPQIQGQSPYQGQGTPLSQTDSASQMGGD